MHTYSIPVDGRKRIKIWNVRKESQNKVSSTANGYVFCFINAHSVGLFSIRFFLRTELAFPFQR